MNYDKRSRLLKNDLNRELPLVSARGFPRSFNYKFLPYLVVLLFLNSNLLAVVYLDKKEALELVFEQPKNAERYELLFDSLHQQKIEKKWGNSIQQKGVEVFKGKLKSTDKEGVVFFDSVIGKHELIDYMVILDKEGTIQFIEILAYRESYGGEIRRENWRNQFHGKSLKEEPEHSKNILNISGATLSCRHVTEGVQKLLVIFDVYSKELGLIPSK